MKTSIPSIVLGLILSATAFGSTQDLSILAGKYVMDPSISDPACGSYSKLNSGASSDVPSLRITVSSSSEVIGDIVLGGDEEAIAIGNINQGDQKMDDMDIYGEWRRDTTRTTWDGTTLDFEDSGWEGWSIIPEYVDTYEIFRLEADGTLHLFEKDFLGTSAKINKGGPGCVFERVN